MNNFTKIHPFIWFDNQAAQAAKFYCSVFDNSIIINESAMTVSFELDGFFMVGLNGGPAFKPNPSISFYVLCDSEEEIETKYKKLKAEGMVMMALDEYAWSPKYAFIQDKHGVCWQLTLREPGNDHQRITPSMLFVNQKNGKAEEAMKLYSSVFKSSEEYALVKYGKGQGNNAGYVMFSHFKIADFPLMAMDGPREHDFDFNEGISFVVNTKDQEETDYFWQGLIANGGSEGQCGWLKDPFGVSWQIVPKRFMELAGDADKAKVQRVMAAMMKMKKFVIEDLERAAEA
ncbi:MAG: VOC family protein [Cytophagales bacterium]|nr:VOC family protein [Cytophagales bacterium]